MIPSPSPPPPTSIRCWPGPGPPHVTLSGDHQVCHHTHIPSHGEDIEKIWGEVNLSLLWLLKSVGFDCQQVLDALKLQKECALKNA